MKATPNLSSPNINYRDDEDAKQEFIKLIIEYLLNQHTFVKEDTRE